MDPSRGSSFNSEPYNSNPWGWTTTDSNSLSASSLPAAFQRFSFDQIPIPSEFTGPLKSDWEDNIDMQKLRIQESEESIFPATILNYKPEFKTLVPPLHFGIDEVHWMHPLRKSFHEILLDTSLEESDEDGLKYQAECQLFNTAVDEPLPFAVRQNLLHEIESHPDIVNYFELTTSNLPSLVKNNQQLAIAILLALMEQRKIADLLDALVEMELSVNTMEVVNRLANNLIPGSEGAALPRPFLHLYISNSIVHCGNITTAQLQNRQARLVCVFLQSLFRNNVIDIHLIPQALLFQIEAFCVEFGRIREATALFTYIKELETIDTLHPEGSVAKGLDAEGVEKEIGDDDSANVASDS